MSKIKLWGKKLLAVSLALAMFAAVGCGGKKDEGATPTTAPGTDKPAATETPDAGTDTPAAPVTISVYRDSFNLASADDAEVKAVQDAINAYIGDKIGVQIELNDIGNSEYKDKVNLALGASEVDLFWTACWIETIRTDDLVKQGAVVDISDKIKNYDIYGSIPEWIWGASTFGGKNYFIPVYKDMVEGYNLMFRKELVDKYGWDLSKVKSIKDIEPMLEDCKAEGLKYPYMSQKTAMFHRYYLDKFDYLVFDEIIAVDKDADAVVNVVQTPEFKEFATLMGSWAEKGYMSEDDLTKTTPDTTTKTQDWGVTYWTDVPNNATANTRYEQEVSMAKITQNWAMSNTTLGSCYAISANASEEKVDAALKFISLLYTDTKLADLYTYGIEGTDYTINADGRVDQTGSSLYNHSMWESAPVTILSLTKDDADGIGDLYNTFNNASVSIASGFRFDSSTVEAQMTACKTVFDEYGFALENGGYKPSEVDQAIADYQQALDDAGFQELLAEVQKQYEAWKAVR